MNDWIKEYDYTLECIVKDNMLITDDFIFIKEDYMKTIRTFETYKYDIFGENHFLKLNCKNNKMDKL